MNDESNKPLLWRLLVVVVVMFGFGFAMVPFYKKICEVAGLNNIAQPDDVRNTQIDSERTVTIEFDANLRGLPWQFHPLESRMRVHPGELSQVNYEIVNTTEQAMTGQAIPSYGPQLAAQYFKKLECFCFTQQTLKAHERRQMLVVFVIDPDLPRDVNTITLSYTFFDLGAPIAVGAKS